MFASNMLAGVSNIDAENIFKKQDIPELYSQINIFL